MSPHSSNFYLMFIFFHSVQLSCTGVNYPAYPYKCQIQKRKPLLSCLKMGKDASKIKDKLLNLTQPVSNEFTVHRDNHCPSDGHTTVKMTLLPIRILHVF
ncbi:corticosteroid 11-beta-dehydrogenase isozyme 2-like [Platysternon megacephalum]|uniref:Corticosteroid 11-beta-dehydrogenase isozyme 2-like n=1 Tax=Platysternon megacephalum TaxID=55544 RepID=A0A4D9EG38_9SAUR|nr:corticosteroid 11-beta-dehydrogenase isozyme 2-like [Platysternon megacephalum]